MTSPTWTNHRATSVGSSIRTDLVLILLGSAMCWALESLNPHEALSFGPIVLAPFVALRARPAGLVLATFAACAASIVGAACSEMTLRYVWCVGTLPSLSIDLLANEATAWCRVWFWDVVYRPESFWVKYASCMVLATALPLCAAVTTANYRFLGLLAVLSLLMPAASVWLYLHAVAEPVVVDSWPIGGEESRRGDLARLVFFGGRLAVVQILVLWLQLMVGQRADTGCDGARHEPAGA